MSKKNEVSQVSSHPHAHAGGQANPPSEFSQTKEAWLSEVQADANAFAAEDKRVLIGAAELLRSARTLEAKIYSPKNADLRRAAWACGLDDGFWAAVRAQVEVVEGHARAVPKDLRTLETITPAESAGVEAAGQYLSDLRNSLSRYAKTKGALAQLEILGRGEAVGASPAQIVASYDTFVTHAAERQELLRGAAIGEAVLLEMKKKRDYVQEVYLRSGQKADEKAALPATIAAGKRALECLLEVYAGRIGVQLAGNAALRTRALKGAPRRADRRKAAADGGGSGEGSGDGAGTSDGANAEGAGTAPEETAKK